MHTTHGQELRFPLVMESGLVAECEALLLVESPCGTKNYLVYTDNSVDGNGALTLFASSYRKAVKHQSDSPLYESDLEPITAKEEWTFIENALQAALAL